MEQHFRVRAGPELVPSRREFVTEHHVPPASGPRQIIVAVIASIAAR
jgi:hypothetical protein